MASQRKTALRTLAAGAVAMAAIVLAGMMGFRINLTPSYPLGLWRIMPKQIGYEVGDLVFVCPPDKPIFHMALQRGYLPRGLCPSGTGPLIKTIAATEGQIVGIWIGIGNHVSIDGEPVPDSTTKFLDADGRPLVPAQGGVVPAKNVFLLSSYPGSFDSRYFGPLPSSGILGLAQPVLTYAP